MQRPDTPDGLFHNGNPATGVKGTTITADWLNALLDIGALFSGDTEPPPANLGDEGDHYLYRGTPRKLYGPKTSGSWGTGVSLKGDKGDIGLTGNPYKSYPTLADANTDLANIPADALIWVNADPTAANIGYWTKTGGVLVQSSYDRVALAETNLANIQGRVTTTETDLSSVQTNLSDLNDLFPLAPASTNFMTGVTGKNLFNLATVTTGYYVSYLTGLVGANASYDVSDYIPILPGVNYYTNKGHGLAFYTSSKVFISGLNPTAGVGYAFTTPSNAAYMRLNVLPSELSVYQLELGSAGTAYEAYSFAYFLLDQYIPVLSNNKIPALTTDKIPNITPPMTSFMTLGKNLFNLSTITTGHYVNYVNGNLDANASYHASDYIPVSQNTDYFTSYAYMMAFYTSSKVFISGLLSTQRESGATFTTPANAAYLRVTLTPSVLSSMQVELGTIKTIYEAFGYKLGNAYAPQGVYASAASLANLIPSIILPNEFVAVVGDELQIFVRGVIEAMDPYAAPYEFVSAVGASYPRYWDYIPTIGDVGTKTLTANVLDNRANIIATKTTNIVVVNPAGAPSTSKNVLCVGDSLTDAKPWPQEAYRRLTQSGGNPAGLGYGNINFVGNKAMASYPTQRYVGYGGWTWAMYNGSQTGYVVTAAGHDKDSTDQHSTWTDSNGHNWSLESVSGNDIKFMPLLGSWTMPNAPGALTWVSGGVHHTAISYTAIEAEASTPFWDSVNNEMSFTSFAANEGITGGIDIMYVLLGWNGMTIPWPDMSNVDLTAAKAFIDQFHSDYPSAKVRIMGIQLPSVNGGLGANYGANGGYSAYYKVVRNVNALNAAYQALASSAPYSSFVKYLAVAPQFDSEYNMQASAKAVNTRSATTELVGINGVHPLNPDGYYQIGDVAFRDFVRTFCS